MQNRVNMWKVKGEMIAPMSRAALLVNHFFDIAPGIL
jgi:hypothetical protein